MKRKNTVTRNAIIKTPISIIHPEYKIAVWFSIGQEILTNLKSTVLNFPFSLVISSGDISGPSAGLMWALGVSDVLTPGDLTGGRVIAGTGAIGPDGTVYPIGGVQEKVVTAKAHGATVFFVPVQDAADARRAATGITLVPVKTYADALHWLLTHGGKA